MYSSLLLLFSILFISAQENETTVFPSKSSSNQESKLSNVKNTNIYFQVGDQFQAELNSYEIIDKGLPNSSKDPLEGVTVGVRQSLEGKLNTGECLNLSKMLSDFKTDAIILESDTTYQITFSGTLSFRAKEFSNDLPDYGHPVKIEIELYGTDAFTLKPDQTNIIQIDIVRPVQTISTYKHTKKMRWKLQVTNI